MLNIAKSWFIITAPYADKFFDVLSTIFEKNEKEFAISFLRNLFPLPLDDLTNDVGMYVRMYQPSLTYPTIHARYICPSPRLCCHLSQKVHKSWHATWPRVLTIKRVPLPSADSLPSDTMKYNTIQHQSISGKVLIRSLPETKIIFCTRSLLTVKEKKQFSNMPRLDLHLFASIIIIIVVIIIIMHQ